MAGFSNSGGFSTRHDHREPLDPSWLPPHYLAYTRDGSEPIEVLHNPLRARYELREPDIVNAMQEWARFAARARESILQRNLASLAELMNENFDLRQQIRNRSPSHVCMVETARRVGASAKYSGSGGAIVGTYRDEDMYLELERELGKINCHVVKPVVGDILFERSTP